MEGGREQHREQVGLLKYQTDTTVAKGPRCYKLAYAKPNLTKIIAKVEDLFSTKGHVQNPLSARGATAYVHILIAGNECNLHIISISEATLQLVEVVYLFCSHLTLKLSPCHPKRLKFGDQY